MFELLEPMGLLPLVVPVWLVASWRIAIALVPGSSLLDRLAAAAVTAMGLVHLLVAGLGMIGALDPNALFAALFLVGGASLTLHRGRSPPESPTWLTMAALFAATPVIIAVVAAWLLPVWQAESLGSHLPFVHLAINGHGFSGLRQLTGSPYGLEFGAIALRLFLPNDQLVDLAQLPYGVAGAILTSAIAVRLSPDGKTGVAALAGALWLFVPSVFLELPMSASNVGAAAALLGAVFFLLLSPLSWRTGVLGAIALGLFLGSRPEAVFGTAIVLLALAVRARRAPRILAVIATLVFVGGAAAHLGNPRLAGTGPLEFLSPLLDAFSPPGLETKLGGLGLPVLLGLPFALVAMVRRPGLVAIGLVAALATPDPSIARNGLAFGALVLALAFAEFESWEAPGRVLVGAAAVAATQLVLTLPGLTGDGPPLSTFWSMSDDERRAAISPPSPLVEDWALWQRVAADEAVAFDEDFEVPALLVPPKLDRQLLAMPKLDPARLTDWARANRVRFVAVGKRYRHAIDSGPWRRTFGCRSERCGVYELDDALLSSR